MSYPNRPDSFVGRLACRESYADAAASYFDETHKVESWDISCSGLSAEAVFAVRREARTWRPPEARSSYAAHPSRQRFKIVRRLDGAVEITSKVVQTFEPTASLYGGLA